ncbi:hypothetical protein MKX01_040612 [Papaver californicum]|nr:hypothetical protein MKX01_040612 [Papaver californicum]
MFLWKLMRVFNIGWERETTKALKTIDTKFYQLISQKRKNLLHEIKSFDLLSCHIKTQEQMSTNNISSLPTKNNDKFLRDSMLSLFFAGKDAIASGLIWFFWLVSKNPTAEWASLFACSHMRIAKIVPPVPVNSKTVLKEVVLPDGSLVKPGMQIIISDYSVGSVEPSSLKMSWTWGEDCLEFKPERWIDGDGRLICHENMSKFVTFNMAFTQIKAVSTAILFNFQVQVLEGQHIFTKPAITLHVENGLKVKLQKRQSFWYICFLLHSSNNTAAYKRTQKSCIHMV